MDQNRKSGADVRSPPSGGLLPSADVPAATPDRTPPFKGKSTAPQGKGPRVSRERVRVARFQERAEIYAFVVAHPGVAWTYVDLTNRLGIPYEVIVNCGNSMQAHPEDYPDIDRPVRGTIRYVGPPREAAPVPAGAALPPAPPDPPAPRPAAPTGPQGGCPDELIVQCLRPISGGWLVVDEDSGVTYVLRRATAADHKEPSP